MKGFDIAIMMLTRLFYGGYMPFVDRQSVSFPSHGMYGIQGMLEFSGVRYPLSCCAVSCSEEGKSCVTFTIGLNITCREEYRDEMQTLLMMINLTSLENIAFSMDENGDIYISTELEIRFHRPATFKMVKVVKNLFALSSDYLIDIESIANDDPESPDRKRIWKANGSYYRLYCVELPLTEDRESLLNARFICVPGYPFSEWINSGFNKNE